MSTESPVESKPSPKAEPSKSGKVLGALISGLLLAAMYTGYHRWYYGEMPWTTLMKSRAAYQELDAKYGNQK